jgi:hypothetical protein
LDYLTLIIAAHMGPARLYAEGWAEWAAAGALPTDAVAYPERAQPVEAKSQSPQDGVAPRGAMLAAALALILAAFAFGWWAAKRRAA